MKVTLLMASSLDGKIAKDSDHFPDWTEKEDKSLFMKLTKDAGVIIMGSKTFDTIGKPLPDRKNIVLTRDESRKSDNPNVVFASDSPEAILTRLGKEGYTHVYVTGGAQINTLFAQAGLLDEVILTISPVVLGDGLEIFSEKVELELQLEKLERLGQDSVTAYYRVIK